MRGSLLFRRADVMGLMTPSKWEWPYELIGVILAVLTVTTFLFIASFAFDVVELAP